MGEFLQIPDDLIGVEFDLFVFHISLSYRFDGKDK